MMNKSHTSELEEHDEWSHTLVKLDCGFHCIISKVWCGDNFACQSRTLCKGCG